MQSSQLKTTGPRGFLSFVYPKSSSTILSAATLHTSPRRFNNKDSAVDMSKLTGVDLIREPNINKVIQNFFIIYKIA